MKKALEYILISIICVLSLCGCSSSSSGLSDGVNKTAIEDEKETKAEIDDDLIASIYDFEERIIKNGSEIPKSDEMDQFARNIILNDRDYVQNVSLEEASKDQRFVLYLTLSGYMMNYYEEGSGFGDIGRAGFTLIMSSLLRDYGLIDSEMVDEAIDTMKLWESMRPTNPKITGELFASATTAVANTLTTGNYDVGTDITPGKYDVMGLSGGNFVVHDPSGRLIVNEIIRENEMVYKNVQLDRGATVEVSGGGKVELQPK